MHVDMPGMSFKGSMEVLNVFYSCSACLPRTGKRARKRTPPTTWYLC